MTWSTFLSLLPWIEFALFGVLSGIALALLWRCQRQTTHPRHDQPLLPPHATHSLFSIPEFRLLSFALPLELLWEIAQFPLYTLWHEGDWGTILYSLIHCTLGDLLILLSVFWLVALFNRSRRWPNTRILLNGILFTVLGLAYTVFSEILNVQIKAAWAYTELMPMVPFINIGGMPFLQWLLIPPLLLWLTRLFPPAAEATTASIEWPR